MNKNPKIRYRRIIIKISGEILGTDNEAFNDRVFKYLTDEILSIHHLGVKIGIVLGGGNIIRGNVVKWFNRINADLCGMIATIINGIILYSHLKEKKAKVHLRSNLEIKGIVQQFNKLEDERLFNQGDIMIFTGGTGNPIFTTDTAAAIKASEFKADLLIKGTKVEGAFSADPEKVRNAKFYPSLSFEEAIQQNLKVMDLPAFNICQEAKIPICVFNLLKYPLKSIIFGKRVGTLIS